MVTLNGTGGDLTKTEFEIGGTRFAVAKLPAMAGFDLLEAIRHELGKSQALSLHGVMTSAPMATLMDETAEETFTFEFERLYY